MPGTHFIFIKDKIGKRRSHIRKALGEVRHMKDYKIGVISETNETGLYTTAFDGYPFRKWEDEDFLIHLEGKIYGLGELEIQERLFLWASALSRGSWSETHTSLFRSTEGEFLMVVFDKRKNRWSILNDAMNHLPFYWYTDGSRFIASRELGFILSMLDGADVDPLSAAQYLIFLFPLGGRTLYRGIHRLDPASHLQIETDGNVKHHRLFQLNFDERRDFHKRKSVLHLAALFQETCDSYVNASPESTRILCLSGGIDSRAVAAGLLTHPPYQCKSFLDPEGKSIRDVATASRVAAKAGCSWQEVDLGQVKGGDCQSILSFKRGMSSLSMAFILPFFQDLLNRDGRKILLFTGNTGMALRDYRPPRTIRSLDSLVAYIFSRHHQFPIETILRLTGVSFQDLREDLSARLETYPENSVINKYIHFIIEGKCLTWHYENADLARYFFWPSAPLEATRFFAEAAAVPDREKEDFRLYRSFLMALSPSLSSIADSNIRVPFSSPLFPLIRHTLDQVISILSLHPSLMLSARKLWTHKGMVPRGAYYRRCLHEMIRSGGFPDWFCPEELISPQIQGEVWSRFQMEILLTVMSVLRQTTGCPSIWESYLGAAMV